MAALAALLLALAMVGGSDAAWCVCRSDQSDGVLQKTLDYACGAGADCSSILQNGACYNPNTVRAHCSYATNSYFQRKGQAQGACDFSGTATLSTTDPSFSGCTYPATASSAATSSTPATNTPGAALSPPSGVFGGLGPSSSLSDNSGGSLLMAGTASLLLTGICSWMALLS
ncbi:PLASMODESMATA CALLOSE-BINDING PROTEIN 2-like [Zingiber officinale]|uniref:PLASMODESMATA CALLOSE-BINDING PROTEIN 2-like n=1 Tax=Zingiber officinale TaxID=94328 RepID=UPI001C4D2E05|nr:PLASMODESMATA CALLOSE-BINDING PROTEIN 2-like [Zingiber officinale]